MQKGQLKESVMWVYCTIILNDLQESAAQKECCVVDHCQRYAEAVLHSR